MRFDDDSQLDTSQVQDTRGRGGFRAAAGSPSAAGPGSSG